MIQDRLWIEIEKVASRYHRLRFWRALTVGWIVATAMIVLTVITGFVPERSVSALLPLLGAVTTMLVVISAWVVHASKPHHEWVARQIENEFPDLANCLMAAIEQQPILSDGRFGFLQESVIRQALIHSACHPWSRVVPTRRLAWAAVFQCVALGVFVLVLTNAPARLNRASMASSGRNTQTASIASGFSVAVEPGDTEIERGTSLLVLARVTGHVPSDATLVLQPNSGDATQVTMSRSLDDPVFGGRVASVNESLDYRVELGTHTTPTYRVTVFEYPRLERADARLIYPSYTSLEERLVQDVRAISVVEGTQVTLLCHLNKHVTSATFTEKNGEPLTLVVVPGERPVYQATLTATKSRRLKLDLVDEAGRHNTESADISIQVVPNQPPSLKLVQPARDLEVSPLEELDVKATAWDDYGIKRMGVSFGLAGNPPVEIVLNENAAARQKHELANAIKFEELKAQPDQLLSYFFWAEDFGPDGNLRRTSSDMYFAEVRHFEEIFRQGQQPPGGQQQRQQQQKSPAGQQAQQLAQAQKEIINATWKLIRRETGSAPSDVFGSDIEQVRDSQSSLLKKAEALGEKLTDEESQTHFVAVLEAMQEAVAQLTTAHDQSSVSHLQPALVAEQSAYQALLKIRAREHEVIRQQQQQSGSSSSSSSARSQQQRQQMQQLDLKNEENRYETQRLAQSKEESAEERETRQILNRLRELARRQHDLNERLKDLQTALQEAQTAERKEEIRQQLKRLQDEQRQVLRDTDELQSRMESPENQERMAEDRQQLEQTRDQVRRASEALEKEMVTQAAASGTRAQREFEELRNEFRRRTSNRFNEEMREMRESARALDQQQKKLSEELNEATKPNSSGQKSLREDNRTDEVARGLKEQTERLSNLTERMNRTIEEAEQTEPLLSERLYNATRTAQDQKVDRALEAAERSLQRGLMEDARQLEQIAGRGISHLREGVEKAAEAVLGDETEALRRAREALKDLSEELNREIARNSPENSLPSRGGDHQQRNGNAPASERANSQSKEASDGQPNAPQNEQRDEDSPRNGQQAGQREPQAGQPGQRSQSGQSRTNKSDGNQSQAGEPQANQPQTSQRQDKAQSTEQPQGQQEPSQSRGQQERDGQPQRGEPQGNESGQSDPGQNDQRSAQRSSRSRTNSGARGGLGPFEENGERAFSPISGEDFLNWSDRLRDVEEFIEDSELRAEAARIRDQARAIRVEIKRHSKDPNWNLVRVNVAEPLVELANRISDELLRRTSKQSIVPLDRDPVPPKYSEKTRRYYERLGSGK